MQLTRAMLTLATSAALAVSGAVFADAPGALADTNAGNGCWSHHEYWNSNEWAGTGSAFCPSGANVWNRLDILCSNSSSGTYMVVSEVHRSGEWYSNTCNSGDVALDSNLAYWP
ncbi:hypothetical protein AB0M43_19405 [Longispora sp. NPDC051575]|uniref:hypothetical protein n=1 Tax=Longispora sp. NPDC051575 TaxID=3154943 RepID=UPI0034218671